MQEDMTPETLTAAVIDTYKDRGALIDYLERETSADGVKNVMALIHKYARPYGDGQTAHLSVAHVYPTFNLGFAAIERGGSADRQAIRDAGYLPLRTTSKV